MPGDVALWVIYLDGHLKTSIPSEKYDSPACLLLSSGAQCTKERWHREPNRTVEHLCEKDVVGTQKHVESSILRRTNLRHQAVVLLEVSVQEFPQFRMVKLAFELQLRVLQDSFGCSIRLLISIGQ